MAILNENDINKRLIDNTALFNNVYVINQKFDIVPDSKEHYGASINFQDIKEVRSEFLNELYYTIVDWVYSSEKYDELKNKINDNMFIHDFNSAGTYLCDIYFGRYLYGTKSGKFPPGNYPGGGRTDANGYWKVPGRANGRL